jgi:disulfide oxidoreductase YuzD
MVQTYSSNKKIYSVDMMFAYINLFKPTATNVNIRDFIDTLTYKGWGEPSKRYSPKDVLLNKTKYASEIKRIKEAELTYPIIVHNNNIVDGVHRLTKAVLQKNTTIKAYVFNDVLMRKFLVNSTGNWNKVQQIGMDEYIELFYKRFRNKK